MLHFKPIKNRVIGLEFCVYFAALAIGPVAYYALSKRPDTGNYLLHTLEVAALMALAIGYKKAKGHNRDIEVNEKYIVGPGPYHWLIFKQPRVKIPLEHLDTKGSHWRRYAIKLDDKANLRHIRIDTALYEKQVMAQLQLHLALHRRA